MPEAPASPSTPPVKVSVLMPVYNTEETHLREAIDSILSQTFRDFEYLIINDASTDPNVEKVVLSYDDARIKYSRNSENMGISGVRNKLIDESRGEYLAVMDHDDISLPERFAKQVEYLDAHPDVGIVGCQAEEIGDRHFRSSLPVNDAEIRVYLTNSCVILHPASMMRKSVLVKNNLRYEEQYSPAEDYALYHRLMAFTKFHNIDQILFRYRWHDQNTTLVQHAKMAAATEAILELMHTQYHILYKKFIYATRHITRCTLFGFLPILKTYHKGNTSRSFLFHRIPFMKTITTRMERKYYLFHAIPLLRINRRFYTELWKVGK